MQLKGKLLFFALLTLSAPSLLFAEEIITEPELNEIIDRFDDVYWINIRNAWIELRNIGKPAVPSLIARVANREEKWKIRYYCIYTLGLLKDKRAVPALAEIVANDPDHRLVYFAMDALGGMPDARAVPAIASKLRDPNFNVRYRAVSHIVKMKSQLKKLEEEEQIVKALYQLCNDQFYEVRSMSFQAVGMFGKSISIPSFIKHLQSEDVNVRQYALAQLMEISKERAQAPPAFGGEKWTQETKEAAEKMASFYERWWQENKAKFSEFYHR